VTDVKERVEKLKSANRCILCLNRGHHTHACCKRGNLFCSRCKKGHHRPVCMDKEIKTSRASRTTSASVGRVDISSPDHTYLQTARVWVTGPTGLSRLTRCVLDGGSQYSFIARSVLDFLQLEVIDQRVLSVTAFETFPTAQGRRRFVRFNMRRTWTDVSTSLTAFESTHASLIITLSRTISRHWRIHVNLGWPTHRATQRTSLLRSYSEVISTGR